MGIRGRRLGSSILAVTCLLSLAGCQKQAEPEPDGRTVHFTASGDLGMGSGARAVLDAVDGLKPDFNVALGDLSYKAGAEDDFCRMVTGKLGENFPFQLIAGNHESDGSEGDIENFTRCLPNKLPGLQGAYGTEWYVDVPQEEPLVRVILISPGLEFQAGRELDYSRGSDHWQWTSAAIDGARESRIPWTVVAMHVPCFSLGHYGCEAGQAITNLLISKKVDLVLTAHEHAYQRTHQLAVSGACPWMFPGTTMNSCIANTSNRMTAGKGTVFAGAGTGGAGQHELHGEDEEAGYFAAWSGANKDPALGTLDVQLSETHIDARFVPAAGYSFTDQFSIVR